MRGVMGKVKNPKVLLVDLDFQGCPEIRELEAQGHEIRWFSDRTQDEIDLIISPKAQMTPPGRIGYVVKKLKDIVKEVAK